MVTSVATGVLNPDDTDGDGFLIFLDVTMMEMVGTK
jgi:hypothetical protein